MGLKNIQLEQEKLRALEQTEKEQRNRAQEAEEHKMKLQSFIDTICHEISKFPRIKNGPCLVLTIQRKPTQWNIEQRGIID